MNGLGRRPIHGPRLEHFIPIGAVCIDTQATDLKLVGNVAAHEEPDGSPRRHAHTIGIGMDTRKMHRPVRRD